LTTIINMLFRLVILQFLIPTLGFCQSASIKGVVKSDTNLVGFASVGFVGTNIGTNTNEKGFYQISSQKFGKHTLRVSAIGYKPFEKTVIVKENENITVNVNLLPDALGLDEVVISGTMKEVSKTESPVPVEVYTAALFKKNPTPSIFDALQNVNGVRPQLNCNVCNTGDIHINGLEGPYTMILIDGMPIVSGLSSVYGLSGIPNSLVERIEIVKGPASSLYGSEAVGGLINIITKKTANADKLNLDVMGTTYLEYNVDAGIKYKLGEKVNALFGMNYYNYQNPVDNNHDGFTDVTLQHRISCQIKHLLSLLICI